MLSIEKKIVLYHHGNIICARICMTDKQNRVENERGRAERKKNTRISYCCLQMGMNGMSFGLSDVSALQVFVC